MHSIYLDVLGVSSMALATASIFFFKLIGIMY